MLPTFPDPRDAPSPKVFTSYPEVLAELDRLCRDGCLYDVDPFPTTRLVPSSKGNRAKRHAAFALEVALELNGLDFGSGQLHLYNRLSKPMTFG